MPKRSKKYRASAEKVVHLHQYSLQEAATKVKELSYARFNASVDIAVRLGVDPRQANQMVRGAAQLPHGTGKTMRVLALTGSENEAAARAAGADHVGLDDYLTKIQGGWLDIDVIVCTPDVMPKLGRLGKILGPRGLMPNPKSGTVTTDIAGAVRDVKAGKIDFRVDKTGIIHAPIGKVSFSQQQLIENAIELLQSLQRLKPQGAKDTYFKSITLSATMSPGVRVEKSSVPGIS